MEVLKRIRVTFFVALIVSLVGVVNAMMFEKPGSAFDVAAFVESVVLIVACTSLILAKLDKISRKIDEKETDK